MTLDFAKVLQQARANKGMTQKDLATVIRVAASLICNVVSRKLAKNLKLLMNMKVVGLYLINKSLGN